MTAYRRVVVFLAVCFVGIGVALISVTAARGGGLGYMLGALFVAAGLGRVYLLRRR